MQELFTRSEKLKIIKNMLKVEDNEVLMDIIETISSKRVIKEGYNELQREAYLKGIISGLSFHHELMDFLFSNEEILKEVALK